MGFGRHHYFIKPESHTTTAEQTRGLFVAGSSSGWPPLGHPGNTNVDFLTAYLFLLCLLFYSSTVLFTNKLMCNHLKLMFSIIP